MVRSALVSLLVIAAASGCAPRTRATIAMAIGGAATVGGSVWLGHVVANPVCDDDVGMPTSGFDGIIDAGACAGADAARALPPALLVSTGAASLVAGIIAYALAPREPRRARHAPLENLRGERWTRLRDERNRGRSGQ
ncbi:MAG TPA: hypothetical protein VM513_00535 [Kofleriaceae bacterium]|nr:hypothetical protein [Kofleriaceae bacterium]